MLKTWAARKGRWSVSMVILMCSPFRCAMLMPSQEIQTKRNLPSSSDQYRELPVLRIITCTKIMSTIAENMATRTTSSTRLSTSTMRLVFFIVSQDVF